MKLSHRLASVDAGVLRIAAEHRLLGVEMSGSDKPE